MISLSFVFLCGVISLYATTSLSCRTWMKYVITVHFWNKLFLNVNAAADQLYTSKKKRKSLPTVFHNDAPSHFFLQNKSSTSTGVLILTNTDSKYLIRALHITDLLWIFFFFHRCSVIYLFVLFSRTSFTTVNKFNQIVTYIHLQLLSVW